MVHRVLRRHLVRTVVHNIDRFRREIIEDPGTRQQFNLYETDKEMRNRAKKARNSQLVRPDFENEWEKRHEEKWKNRHEKVRHFFKKCQKLHILNDLCTELGERDQEIKKANLSDVDIAKRNMKCLEAINETTKIGWDKNY